MPEMLKSVNKGKLYDAQKPLENMQAEIFSSCLIFHKIRKFR